jgi:hypothetical protein
MLPKCAACGSERLVHRARLFRAPAMLPGEIVMEVPPAGLPGTERYRTTLRADACIDCGHVQVHAVDLTVLREAYERQQAESLHVGA